MKIRRYIPQIILVTLILIIGFALVSHPNVVNAQASSGGIAGAVSSWTLMNTINYALSKLATMILSIASLAVAFSAYILDISIKLTLHIKEFVEATPAIYEIWQALRDITGLFFIFFLLQAAFKIILSESSAQSYGELIKNIVIAGILINFSFFITSVLIDASNIVSQAIYNSMAPNHATVTADSIRGGLTKMTKDQENNIDISSIFMNSLKIQKLYDPKSATAGVGDSIRIVLIAVAGVVMMITTAASFIIAAIAFIARLVILLFLLAFSPLWFAGRTLIPSIKSKFNAEKELYEQLVFMPAYLLLMYVALKIVNSSTFLGDVAATPSTLATGTNWMFPFIILAVNFTIVIIMLNLPLVVGLSMGGRAVSLVKDKMSKWDAGKVWAGVGGWAGKKIWAGTGQQASWANTGGRVASVALRSETLKDFASRSKVGALAFKGVSGAAEGYNKKLATQVEAKTKFASSLGFDQNRMNYAQSYLRKVQSDLATAKARNAPQADIDALERDLGMAKGDISTIENERAKTYATRTNKGSIETIYSKVARKNKLAAAKIQIPILEKEVTRKKEGLKEVRDDIKILLKTIKNNPAVGNTPAGQPNPVQQTELDELKNEEVKKINSLNDTEKALDELKLTR